jgi:DNA-binding GntR family transcriptional regulator
MGRHLSYREEEGLTAVPASGHVANLAAIVNDLEEDIVFGRVHPRERLIEDELLARFQTKRHLVRQALVDLERMGLVERVPNRGAMVRAYSAEEVRQLYVVRDLLETQGARLIPLPLPDADLNDLRDAQAVHDRAVSSGDLRGVFRANIAFHCVLFDKCGNAFLAETINDFAQRAHGIRFHSLSDPESVEQARQEHWLMIEAIEKRERKTLVKLCSSHLIASKEAYLRAYLANGS